MAKVTNVPRKAPGRLQENPGKRVGWEACGGLAAVVAEAVRRTCAWLCGDVWSTCAWLCGDVWRTCVWLCMTARVGAVRRCVEDLCMAVHGCASWGRDVRG
jgi:hypothetical protein